MPRSTDSRNTAGAPGPSCDAVLEGLEAYLDSLTDPTEAAAGPDPEPPDCLAAIAGHLGCCPACAHELTLAARIREELRSLPSPAPLRPLPWSADRTVPPPRRWRTTPAAAALLAAVVAAVIGLMLLLRPGSAPPAASHLATVPAAPATGAAPSREPPSREELRQAEAEVRYAFARIGDATRHAGLELRDDVFGRRFVAPTTAAFTRALDLPAHRSRRRTTDP